VTDASAIPPESLAHLHGLDVLVLNALRQKPHPTHFSLGQALEQIEALKPRRALLVHMTHDMEHQAINAALPDHVRLAFDGQIIEIGGEEYVPM
jgi:phosphoribosyl 1,2-cyclic phosphate phosphodiesterase